MVSKKRTYRLGKLLRHKGACSEWREFVEQFCTAEEVFDAINADPYRLIFHMAVGGLGFDVRNWAEDLARAVDRWDDALWWRSRVGCITPTPSRPNDIGEGPLTKEEYRRFLALWKCYADAHGLYE